MRRHTLDIEEYYEQSPNYKFKGPYVVMAALKTNDVQLHQWLFDNDGHNALLVNIKEMKYIIISGTSKNALKATKVNIITLMFKIQRLLNYLLWYELNEWQKHG